MKRLLIAYGIVLLFVTPAMAITGIGFGVHGGRATGFTYQPLNSAISSNADANHWLKTDADRGLMSVGGHVSIGIMHLIEIFGFADYAWDKTELSDNDELKVSDFSYGLTAIEKFGLPIANPYVGVGVAWHRFAYNLEAPIAGPIYYFPKDQTKFGYHVVGGVQADIPMFPLAPYAEFKYNWINTEEATTRFGCLIVGISLKF